MLITEPKTSCCFFPMASEMKGKASTYCSGAGHLQDITICRGFLPCKCYYLAALPACEQVFIIGLFLVSFLHTSYPQPTFIFFF